MIFQKINIILWTERLSMLLRSGISLAEALQLMVETSAGEAGEVGKGRNVGRLFNVRLLDSVNQGRPLSVSLESERVSRTLIHLIRVGETSGSLAETVRHASDYFRMNQKIRQKIIGAMVYPVFIGIATLGVAGFLVAFIFPKVMPLFISMNVPLPLPTRILLLLSQVIAKDWLWICLGLLIATVGSILMYRRMFFVRQKCQRALLRLPFVSSIVREHVCSNLFELLNMQLKFGCLLPDALNQMAMSTGMIEYRSAFFVIAEDVTRGKALSQSLGAYRALVSPDVIALLSIAERTGDISNICAFVAEQSRERISRVLENFSRMIEPVLMLGMGIVVGSIALSIIMPIYEITNRLNMH